MSLKNFGGEGEAFRGFAAHSRRIVVSCAKHSFTPDTPCFGSFAAQKHHTVMFLLAHPCRYSRSYEFKYPIQAKNKTTRLGGFIFWRRRRDLNSRAGYVRPTPLAGAPLRPLEYFSKYLVNCRFHFVHAQLLYMILKHLSIAFC